MMQEYRDSGELSTTGTAVGTDSPLYRGPKIEKGVYDDTRVPFLTGHTFFMAILISMGVVCFGYDTGKAYQRISEMQIFLYNFVDTREPEFEFTWWRLGLIVGMLSIGTLISALISAPIANQPRIGRLLCI